MRILENSILDPIPKVAFIVRAALSVGAVAFFVLFARPAGAGVVAAYFCACADRFWRFGLRGACLILQFFLLALLLALHLASEFGQALRRWFAGAGCRGASYGSVRTRTRRLAWARRSRSTLGRLLVLLDL